MKTESLRIVLQWLREVEDLLKKGDVETAALAVTGLREDLLTFVMEEQ